MGIHDIEARRAAGLAKIRIAADIALAAVLASILLAWWKPSMADSLDVPLKLLMGITVVLLIVRALGWTAETKS